MKVAIAFGFGKESMDMLETLKRQGIKPLLITCIGDDDDVDPRAVKIFGKGAGLKTKLILEPCGYKDCITVDDICDSTAHYENTITRYYKGKRKPYDVLYVGRKKNDYLVRELDFYPHVKNVERDLIEAANNMMFPYWDK
jgi:hypothetical protein